MTALIEAMKLLGVHAWSCPLDQAAVDAAWTASTNPVGQRMLLARAGIRCEHPSCACPTCAFSSWRESTASPDVAETPCVLWSLVWGPAAAAARRALCDQIRREHPRAPRIEELLACPIQSVTT